MKIINKRIGRWKDGFVTLEPTSDEDMWHIYNLIRPGDWMRTSTKRKITHTNEKTGLKKIVKKSITLTLVIK
jgi:protein pelota